MTLASGTRLSGYEVLQLIGSGGMGEVYRARDLKLGREVAVKVLPEALRQDRERLARFEREARVLASLNHPGIATLYGLENAEGITFLTMELVPGETLQERLTRGPLTLDEVRELFSQIAAALEAAHRAGVVHRDLKPANVKITPTGRIKILDFGLAKAFAAEEPAADLSHSPTITRASGGTRAGVILGTASYMSPEQAKGKAVDERADIWAFGCLLFEALVGRKAFDGESVTDILANVIHKDVPWEALAAGIPWRVRDILRRCLAKDAGKRFHHIADVRLELIEIEAGEGPEAPSAPKGQATRRRIGAARIFAGFLAGAAIATLLHRNAEDVSPPRGVARYTIRPPVTEPPLELESPAISPDGRLIAYVGTQQNESRLYLRHIDAFESRVLEGTEGAAWPDFSPDGRWLSFFAGDKLKKISVLGGAPLDITDAYSAGPGGGWAPDGSLWFSGNWISGLYRVSADGGTPTEATVLDRERGDVGHWWPDFLPGGKAALVTIFTNKGTQVIGAFDVEAGSWKLLFPGMRARYVRSGHIIYYHAGVYQAVPFDAARLELTGDSVPILSGTAGLGPTGDPEAFFDVSETGTAVTVPGGAVGRRAKLAWLDPNGALESLPFESASFWNASLDPTEEKLAAARNDGGTLSIWRYDLSSGTEERLTRGSHNLSSFWSPDGARIFFTSARRGDYDVYSKVADALAPEEPVVETDRDESVLAISPDGKWLAIGEYRIETGEDLTLFSLEDPDRTRPLASTTFAENSPSFSRDSEWVAFRSRASGRSEIYVQRVSRGESRPLRVSQNGGEVPLFSRTKEELYYLSTDSLMAVSYAVSNDGFRARAARRIVGLPPSVTAVFDVASDGRFLVRVDSGEDPPPTELRIITNWFEELNALAPPAR